MSSLKNEKSLIKNENEDLKLLEEHYPWVISELVAVYYPLSHIREKQGNGFFLLPCSEENLLINLKSHDLSELNTIEKAFPDFFRIENHNNTYSTEESRSYSHHRIKHDKEFQNIDRESTERVIHIQDQLLHLAEKQFQQYTKNKFKKIELPHLKTKADLLILYIVNQKIEYIDSVGLILADLKIRDSKIDKDKNKLKMHFPLDKIPDSRKEDIWNYFMRVLEKNELLEKFFENHETIMIRGHSFNTNICVPHNYYLIPKIIWSDLIKAYTDTEFEIQFPEDVSNRLHSTILEIEFINTVIERKFENNLSMKQSNYEEFHGEIEMYRLQGLIQIAPNGEIITPRDHNAFISRLNELNQELPRIIEKYLNLSIDQYSIAGKLSEKKTNYLQSGE